jgi:hypothetical protein
MFMRAFKLPKIFLFFHLTLLFVISPQDASSQILPPCPAPVTVAEFYNDPIPWVKVLLDGAGSAFSRTVVKGLGRTPACASMNYIPPVPFGVLPQFAERGVNATVSPSTIALTDSFTDVTFDIVGLGVPAPFHTSFPECFPRSANGTCVNSPLNPIVAIRTENPDGTFSGPWSVLWDWKSSPVQFDRIGDCISTAPVGTETNSSTGPPCTYRVTFLRNPNSNNSFVLDKRTQLIVHTSWQGGIFLSSDGTSTDSLGSDNTIFSMLLTPDRVTELPKIESVNPQIRQIISTIQSTLKRVQQRFPKSKEAIQSSYATQLRNSSRELVELIASNPGKIQTTNKKINISKLSKSIRSSVLSVLKRNARTFTSDRKKAYDSLKALLNGLTQSS